MIEVIGAGFGRTGSYSLRVALQRLGYDPCHHMASLAEDPEMVTGWETAVHGGQVRWERFLASYRAAVDWPACAFWRELIAAFPQAKVVLTVRDPARWYASAHQTIYRYMAPRRGPAGLVMRLENSLHPPLGRRRAVCRRLIWEDTFGGRFLDRAHAMEVFERHNAEVVAGVPADRLLVFDVRQGWEPLCGFLGVAVPSEPFPHLNEAAAFRRMAAERRWRTLLRRRTRITQDTAIR
ncbi:sulfotransferase family protein [Nonomuraea monospora]|uniref:Sulfotransferase family protein n=1 Tax=Nonomuraea monospora TaxID=568818 RepID=A0ABN3C6G5_9ACTN